MLAPPNKKVYKNFLSNLTKKSWMKLRKIKGIRAITETRIMWVCHQLVQKMTFIAYLITNHRNYSRTQLKIHLLNHSTLKKFIETKQSINFRRKKSRTERLKLMLSRREVLWRHLPVGSKHLFNKADATVRPTASTLKIISLKQDSALQSLTRMRMLHSLQQTMPMSYQLPI